MKNFSYVISAALAVVAVSAMGEVLDRPSGIKIGSRLTLRPYVSVSASYDSNVESYNSSVNKDKGDVMWTISPELAVDYKADNWSLLLRGYYSYRAYSKSNFSNYNSHNYGETLRWAWSDSSKSEKGWSLVLSESFRQITMAEDFVVGNGTHYSGDQRQFQVNGAAQRRFTSNLHGDVNASYYWLDYMNDTGNRYALYGWDRWSVGADAGFAPSKWTDFLISGSYMGYSQDNIGGTVNGRRYDNDSSGFAVQAGIGSYMTERISYRALAGWSQFKYSNTGSAANGFVYTLSSNWRMTDTLNSMLLVSSYYQPSERQYASRSRVDAASWGLTKLLVRNKLRTSLDLLYRHETHESVLNGSYDYALDIVTGRIGVNYAINRFLETFAHAEYRRSWNDASGGNRNHGVYDYERWRLTAGLRFTY